MYTEAAAIRLGKTCRNRSRPSNDVKHPAQVSDFASYINTLPVLSTSSGLLFNAQSLLITPSIKRLHKILPAVAKAVSAGL